MKRPQGAKGKTPTQWKDMIIQVTTENWKLIKLSTAILRKILISGSYIKEINLSKKSSEDLSDRFNIDLSKQNVPLHQSQSVLIKTTSDTDYYEIKQEHRDVSSFLV